MAIRLGYANYFVADMHFTRAPVPEHFTLAEFVDSEHARVSLGG